MMTTELTDAPKINETVKAKSIVRALNVANELREAFGEDTLLDLPKGLPRQPNQCILANAFNFNCAVKNNFYAQEPGYPKDPRDRWYAEFTEDKKAQADKLSQLIWKKDADLKNDQIMGVRTYRVRLPRSISQIARWFDNHKLQEYELEQDHERTIAATKQELYG